MAPILPKIDDASISQINAYGLLAVLSFGLMAHATAVVSTSILWRTKWYEGIQNKFGWWQWTLNPWWQGLGWMSHQILLAVSVFLFIERFRVGDPANSSNGDFNWVYGWLVAAEFLGYVIPISIASVGNFYLTGGLMGLMDFAIVLSFGYMLRFTKNGSAHLALGDPAIWTLLFPVFWVTWNTGVVFGIASHDDGLGDKGMISDKLVNDAHIPSMLKLKEASPNEAALRQLLKPDTNPSTKAAFSNNITPMPAAASLNTGAVTNDHMHNAAGYGNVMRSTEFSRTEARHTKKDGMNAY